MSNETYKALVETVVDQRATELGTKKKGDAFLSVATELLLQEYLRGMDTVHRNIEDHLKGCGLFYERRKNQYKNLGKSRSDIVTLAEMAQSLMAAILFRPADARGRPNSLLKSDEDYQRLFSEAYNLDTFKNVILARRAIIDRLTFLYPAKPASFRNDVVFHVLTFISAGKFSTPSHAAAAWKDMSPTPAVVDAAIGKVVPLFEAAGGTDRVAKSPAFQKAVIAEAVPATSAANTPEVIGAGGEEPANDAD